MCSQLPKALAKFEKRGCNTKFERKEYKRKFEKRRYNEKFEKRGVLKKRGYARATSEPESRRALRNMPHNYLC
jgi:hypothetical protein